MSVIDAAMPDSIRALLGVADATISDEMIRDPLLGGAVEQRVRDRIGPPTYEDRPADEQRRVWQAVAFLIAARLLGTRALREFNGTQSVRFSDQYQTQRNAAAFDLDGWRADLEAQADEALRPLLARRATALFTLAPGRRGA